MSTSPAVWLSLALVLSSAAGSSGLQNVPAGFTLSLRLSNYRNPHQVSADTGEPCDPVPSGYNFCDPYFEVQLGTQPVSFHWQLNSSRVFPNAFNLTGEFYRADIVMQQELPDALYISVRVMDSNSLEADGMVIAQPIVVLSQLLPSIPGRSNTRRQLVEYTPENAFVSFDLTVEATCLRGLFGRRCSTLCNGDAVYRPWNQARPAESLEIQECRQLAERAGTAAVVFSQPRTFIVIGAISVAALLVLGIGVCLVVRVRGSHGRRANTRASLPNQGTSRQVSQQYSAMAAYSQTAGGSQTSRFSNPVYTAAQQQLRLGAAANHATRDSSVEEIYEDEEDGRALAGPPLPPKRI